MTRAFRESYDHDKERNPNERRARLCENIERIILVVSMVFLIVLIGLAVLGVIYVADKF